MGDNDEWAFTGDEHDYEARERYVDRLIRLHRKKKNWRQEDLADAMQEQGFGWEQPTVARVERGQRRVSFRELVALVDVLDVDAGAFWIRISSEPHDDVEEPPDNGN
jgi:transcriptional regulator with XRE-family HTH domain